MVGHDDEPFDQACMAELAKIARIADQPKRIEALHAALAPIGLVYRRVIATTPSDLPSAPYNVTLTKRADWLDANVINPSQRLLDALGPDQAPMFSTWPDDSPPPTFPDAEALTTGLRTLHEFAAFLAGQLRQQQEGDANHSQEIRGMVWGAIARAVREVLPEIKVSRGTHDREARRRIGMYPDLMRRIFHEITGANDLLDRAIRGEIDNAS